jgi:threonylcarbamoyladenosine tRNA methylthiotransferase MtaB
VRTFYLQTFGCKLNQSDTAALRAELTEKGMRESAAPGGADLIIVNTCTVTSRADRHARQAIRRLKRAAPGSRLVVTGCYAQRLAGRLGAFPEVDKVFGLSERPALIRYATGSEARDSGFSMFDVDADFGTRSRAFLKIQEGCNLSCAYCVVRLVRGRSRSLPGGEVIRRLRSLRQRGYEEVVLTGIHMGLWGRDIGEGSLIDLLKKIIADRGLPKVRLCSLEPFEVDEQLLCLMGESDRIAHHLHLAAQSGSADILKAMRRPPNPEEIRRTVERARELMPECGIGADVIVGFPGETEEDFRQTVNLLTGAPFTYAHVFAFSARPGTEAARMPGKVHTETITRRSAELRAKMSEKNFLFRQNQVGVELPAILLGRRGRDGRTAAITDNYLHVEVEGVTTPRRGAACKVVITMVDRKSTTARPIEL